MWRRPLLWMKILIFSAHHAGKAKDTRGRGGIVLTFPSSVELWDKLSRDSVFYNPITGSIGQFQWTRSETNRAYLNALGVTINYDEVRTVLRVGRVSIYAGLHRK